jgi:plastocyanin
MRRRGAIGVVCAVAMLAALAPAAAQARGQTFTLRSRAFTLSGFQTIFPKVGVPSPRRSGFVTRMDAWLVDERGHRVTIHDVMLHHIVFINSGRPGGRPKNTSCPGRRGGEPFWGTGEEKQPLILPFGYGYQVAKKDRWTMQAMLMSHSLHAHRVHVVFRVRMVLGAPMKRVKPLWLRANGCTTHPSYDIEGDMPPGGIHRRDHFWRVPLSGRIVAASAHLHGSAYGMTITQPRCGDRTLVRNDPLYGYPDDVVYQARPVLHEPGPIATGNFQSKTGIPIRKGEILRVSGMYDGTRPHPRVMAIAHVYVAIDADAPRGCDPLPSDAHIHWTRTDGRHAPPVMTLPINGLGADGQVHAIDRPPGAEVVTSQPRVQVSLRGERIVPANLSVARNTEVTWNFLDPVRHNVTLASGPRHVASANLARGSHYAHTLSVPGTYKLFCYLHPITMTQVISVRP